MADIVWEDIVMKIRLPALSDRIEIELNNLPSYSLLTEQEKRQARDGLLMMNYESVFQKFIQAMENQVNKWDQPFKNSLDAKECLMSIRDSQNLGMNPDKIGRLCQMLCQETPKFNKKYEKINHFAITLAQFFLIAGQEYMKNYGIEMYFKNNYELQIVIRVAEVIASAYRKKSRFYHHRIDAMIHQNIKMIEHTNLARIDSIIYANIHSSTTLYTSVEMTLLTQFETNEFEKMREALSKHNDMSFRARIHDIEKLIKEYRTDFGPDWNFLTIRQASTLRNVLQQTLQSQYFSRKQKNQINSLINSQKFINGMLDSRIQENVKSLKLQNINMLRVMVNLVQFFLPHYSGYVRYFLKKVFRQLSDLKYGYSNYICLTFLENKQLATSDTLERLRSGSIDLTQYLNKIRWSHKILQDIPKIELKPIGKNFKKCKVVSIYISGFRCQNHDKAQFWRNLLYHGQTYALNWQGGTGAFMDLFRYNDKDKVAKTVGKYIGYFIMEQMKGCLINLIGFSLGTGVIQSILETMKQDLDMINDVVFLGGVASTQAITLLMFDHPFHLVNCYSPNDHALSKGLSIFKPGSKPIGLQSLKLPCVQNINTTSFTNWNGHKPTFIELRKRVEFGTDIFYTIPN